MNSRKVQSVVDQELDRRKARAWDKLYEWATGRTLVHVSVDLDDIEGRMDELLVQENAEHDDKSNNKVLEALQRVRERIETDVVHLKRSDEEYEIEYYDAKGVNKILREETNKAIKEEDE